MPRKPRCPTEPARTVRCVIYTRKSTEEGLEQPFNSLDAQREAAEAYIASQRHQGWTLLPERYDDGGYTGANMDRPALQRLLQAVQSGSVDCVVVYKVDRLTRSLLDFARIMDALEKYGATFVSITQHFNTTASIGRLTLNILLSFAQFERELIGERTRDKMWAAKRKGKWVGGTPPLGYDVAPEGGRLIVNAREAEIVREIFSLYLERGSVMGVVEELNRRGRKTKEWTSRRGQHHDGLPFSKNAVTVILRNRTYAGETRFQGETYPGEHPPIVDGRVSSQVERKLRASESQARLSQPSGALLSGVLYCAQCNVPLLATHSTKATKRYRYYVCSTAQRRGWRHCPTKSVNAAEIEHAVLERLRLFPSGAPKDARERVLKVIKRVTYDRSRRLARVQFREQFGGEEKEIPVMGFSHGGKTGRLPRIARLVALAIRCEELVRTGVVDNYAELATLGIVSRSRITQIMNLMNLAPQIQEEILFLPEVHGGRDSITERSIRKLCSILDWGAQVHAWKRLTAGYVASTGA